MQHIQSNILSRVRTGMEVRDLNDERVGTVSAVQLSDEDPQQPGPETAGADQAAAPQRDALSRILVEAFGAEIKVPEALQERLLHEGYIRVDTGLLHSDRFVLADQISTVEADTVNLRVLNEELIKNR